MSERMLLDAVTADCGPYAPDWPALLERAAENLDFDNNVIAGEDNVLSPYLREAAQRLRAAIRAAEGE